MKLRELLNKPKCLIKVVDIPKDKYDSPYVKNGHKFQTDKVVFNSIYVYKDHIYFAYSDLIAPNKLAYVPVDYEVEVLSQKELEEYGDAAVEERNNLLLKLFNDPVDPTLPRTTVTLGSDPEIFCEDKDGNIIPAFDFLKAKSKSSTTSWGGTLVEAYWDGFQAEFTTSSSTCLSSHVDSIQSGIKMVHTSLKAFNRDAKLSRKTVFDIPPALLLGSKDEHVALGCAPSLNAYGFQGRLAEGRELAFRPAGGHIHIGMYQKQLLTKELAERSVKAMDAIAAVACVSLFEKYDDKRRREMYGLVGEYRLPKHGIEYRTLSNAWLVHPFIANIVFDITRQAFLMGYHDIFQYVWKGNEDETIKCVQECNVELAREILLRNKETLRRLFHSVYRYNGVSMHLDTKAPEYIFNVFMKGIDSIIKDSSDFESNWNLNGTWVGHSDGKNKNWLKGEQDIIAGKKLA